MNLKNLLTFCAVMVFLLIFAGETSAQTDVYVNSTSGFDSNPGTAAQPWATLEKAYRDAPTGATVHVAAGTYTRDESGTGGGNDADGYQFGVAPGPINKRSITFQVETFAPATNVLTLNSGDLIVDAGTSNTVKFQPATAGLQTISLAPTAGKNLTLTSGTLNVSTTSGFFNISANVGASGGNFITRTEGFLTGTPTFAAGPRDIVYNGTSATAQTTGAELPATIKNLVLSKVSSALTVSTALTLGYTGGSISGTTASAVTFQQPVTLESSTAAAVPVINNGVGATWTFSSPVVFNLKVVANSYAVTNSAGGSIVFNALLNFKNVLDTTTYLEAGIRNTGAGVLSINAGLTETNNSFNGVFLPAVGLYVTAGTVNLGGAAVSTTLTGSLAATGLAGGINNAALSTSGTAVTVKLNGNVTFNKYISHTVGILNLQSFTATIPATVTPLLLTSSVVSTGIGSGLLNFTNPGAIVVTGNTVSLPNVQSNDGNVTINATPSILGNAIVNGSGTLTLAVATTAVTGSVINQGPAIIAPYSGDFVATGVITVGGNIISSGVDGNIDLGTACTTVSGYVSNRNSGVINLDAATSIGSYVETTGANTGVTPAYPAAFTAPEGDIEMSLVAQIGGSVTVAGQGNIYNESVVGAENITGNIRTTAGSTGDITSTVTNLTGYVSLGGSGDITLNSAVATGIKVNDSLSVTGTGVFNNSVVSLLVVGNASIYDGEIRIGASAGAQEVLTVQGNFSQFGGLLNYIDNIFDFKGSIFTRTNSALVPVWANTANYATQKFSMGGTQTVTGGANMSVYNLNIEINGTKVVMQNGTFIVNGNALISAGTSMDLGAYAVRMVGGLSPAAPVLPLALSTGGPFVAGLFTNAGSFTATTGGVYLEAPTAANGLMVQAIDGAGTYGNIDVRLGNELDYVGIGPSTPTITFQQNIVLRKGTIAVTSGQNLQPTNVPTAGNFPKVLVNVEDVNSANGPDGKVVLTTGGPVGTFNKFLFPYDLEYFCTNTPTGKLLSSYTVGSEFQDNTVRNLNISAISSVIATNFINLTANKTINGNLTIDSAAVFNLTGGSIALTASSSAFAGSTVHTINGYFSRAGSGGTGEAFVITGPATVTSTPTKGAAHINTQFAAALTRNKMIDYLLVNAPGQIVNIFGIQSLGSLAG